MSRLSPQWCRAGRAFSCVTISTLASESAVSSSLIGSFEDEVAHIEQGQLDPVSQALSR